MPPLDLDALAMAEVVEQLIAALSQAQANLELHARRGVEEELRAECERLREQLAIAEALKELEHGKA